MPLVVPGIMSGGGDKTSDWMNKLAGKKLGDSSNETVSFSHIRPCSLLLDTDKFPTDICKDGSSQGASRGQGGRHDDHGPQARTVRHSELAVSLGSNALTLAPASLNIHTSADGTVTKVTHG
jgi:hypothetical protein